MVITSVYRGVVQQAIHLATGDGVQFSGVEQGDAVTIECHGDNIYVTFGPPVCPKAGTINVSLPCLYDGPRAIRLRDDA